MIDSNDFFSKIAGKNFTRIKLSRTIPEFIDHCVREYKNSVAISWEGSEKTYEELYNDIAQIRSYLIKKGFHKGDNIAIVMKNDYDFVRSFFAITTIGAVAVLVPPTVGDLCPLCNKFDIKGVIYCDEVSANAECLSNVMLVSSQDLGTISDVTMSADESILPEDPAAIIFTSGTTSMPKGAILSHRALMRGAYNGSFSGYNDFGLKYMVLIPLFHVFGLVRNLFGGLNTGANVYLVKDVKLFTKEIKNVSPQIMVLVPALAEVVYNLIVKYGIAFVGGRLKCIVCGGANINPELIERFSLLDIQLNTGYGSTETSNLVSGSDVLPKDKRSSVGILFPGQEYKLINGELCIKGDNVFSGYYNAPEETAKSMTEDGYFKTGDIVRFDEDGYMYIIGRKKNLIILDNGENVSPEIIENALDNNNLIKASMVFETKDNRDKSIIAVKIFPDYAVLENLGYGNVDKIMEDIVAKVNDTNPSYMQVKKVIILKEDFKRSGNMKIIRSQNI